MKSPEPALVWKEGPPTLKIFRTRRYSGQSAWKLACLLAILFLSRLVSSAAPGAVQSVTAPGLTVISGAGNSSTPSISGDGRSVVFISQAKNLVTNSQRSPYLDVFVRDLVLNRTTLVSVNSSGMGGGDADSNLPAISSNGQFIAFESAASNLAGIDTNGTTDVFVRDVLAGTTMLASVATNGGRSGNGPSSNPTITPDGRWLIFESSASDLVANDTNGVPNIFLRDLQAGVTSLVSVGQTNGSSAPSISADGHLAAFLTSISNPSPAATVLSTVYARDVQINTTIDVTAQATNFFIGGQFPIRCLAPILSADGRFVAYKVVPANTNAARLFRYAFQTGSTLLISTNTTTANPPEVSADGRFIGYEDGTNVFVWDGQTGSNILASARLDGTQGGNQPSSTPVLAADGSKVVFLSAAIDLATNAVNGVSQIFVRDLTTGVTRLVSVNQSGGPSSVDIDVTLPAISSDGRLIAFESAADDLVSGDYNLAGDVFVRDLDPNTTRLISERAPSLASATGVAVTSVLPSAISADGHIVAFRSRDGNLTMGDTNSLTDVFVRDLSAGINSGLWNAATSSSQYLAPSAVVSADGRYAAFIQQEESPPNAPGIAVWRRDLRSGTNERASLTWDYAPMSGAQPTISSDGRMIAFVSIYGPFIPNQSGTGITNLFLHDFQPGGGPATNRIIAFGNGQSTEPLFSPDGRWIVFTSLATNLVTNAGPTFVRRLYVHDLANSTNRLISIGPDSSVQWTYGHGSVFSADSRFVAWSSGDTNVFLTGLLGQSQALVCSNCENPSLSGDGHLIAYETPPSATIPFRQVFVRDLQSGATNLVSISRAGATGNGHSTNPQISADGRFVVFASKADDLAANDTNGWSDIFVRDRLLGTTLLVSLNAQGTGSGNSASGKPLLAADGRTAIFQSFASDLIAGDFNERRDIFVLHLGGTDSDGDGLDDDWEMTYFGDLSRDGSGDFDHDGQSDREEFLAGTNPTNDASLLRVLTLTGLSGGNARLLWSAVPGRTYRVQFKDSVSDPQWTDLSGDVTATTETASTVDSGAAAQAHRFYRVQRLP